MIYKIILNIVFLIIFCVHILHPLDLYAEARNNLEFILKVKKVEISDIKETKAFYQNETSEIKLFFLGIIRGYQLLLSTQDKPSCNFTPSCSKFGVQAIKRYGVGQGILMTSDRLQRCNGYRKPYPIDKGTGLAIDPVKKYAIWKKN